MLRTLTAIALLGLGLTSSPLLSQETTAPASGTALAEDPADLVAARRAMMAALAEQFAELTFAAGEATEDQLFSLQVQARSVAAMLRGFPHLFPETTAPTNDAFIAAGIDTDAAEAVWTDFATFYQLSHQAADQASAMGAAATVAEIVTLSTDLQTSCDTCHATYLAYEPFSFTVPGDVPLP